MKYPLCPDVALNMSEYQGIEIGYCPQRRGVWLDRGELDELIKRAVVPAPSPNKGSAAQAGYRDERQNYRKKSWRDNIFY